MVTTVGTIPATSMIKRPFVGLLNIEPPTCLVCGSSHEQEYPHEATEQFQKHICRMFYRDVVYSDLWAHTDGLIRAGMIANTGKIPLPPGVSSWTS